ncbi:MAG: hypothetical protein HQM12_05750, partial [SAR324 cluster bacterium]|nr:hypothetical protein [SAR324 cluster bacterium]
AIIAHLIDDIHDPRRAVNLVNYKKTPGIAEISPEEQRYLIKLGYVLARIQTFQTIASIVDNVTEFSRITDMLDVNLGKADSGKLSAEEKDYLDRIVYLLNHVENTQAIVEVLNHIEQTKSVVTVLQEIKDSNDQTATVRLALLINRLKGPGRLSVLLNQTFDTPQKQANLMRLLNEVKDMDKLAGIIGYVENIENLSMILEKIQTNAQNSKDGLASLITLINEVDDPQNLVILINQVRNVQQMLVILKHLDHRNSPTGALKMAELINQISREEILSVQSHLIRLIDDLSHGTSAANVAQIINGLEFKENHTGGLYQLVSLLKGLSTQDPEHPYKNALDTHQSDAFGRLTAFINAISGSGTRNTVVLLNQTDPAQISALIQLIGSVYQIQKVADLVNGIREPEHVVTLLNALDLGGKPNAVDTLTQVIHQIDQHPDLTIGHLVRLVNDLSSGSQGARNVANLLNDLHTRSGSIANLTQILAGVSRQDLTHPYNHPEDTGTTDHFGRLTTLINAVSDHGTANISSLINDVKSEQIPALVMLVRDVPKISLLTGLINRLNSPQQMVTLLNHLDSKTPAPGTRNVLTLIAALDHDPDLSVETHLVRLINELSRDSSGAENVARILNGLSHQGNTLDQSAVLRMAKLMSTLHENDMDHPYRKPNETAKSDRFGRLLTLINTIDSAGSRNVVTLLNVIKAPQLGCLSGLIANMEQIGYLTDLINGVDDAATVAELINHLDLQGNPSGCDKLRITLETVAHDPGLTIKGALVRFINQLSRGENGARNVASVINGIRPDGENQVVKLLAEMSHEQKAGRNSQEFAKLTDLLGGLSQRGSQNVHGLLNNIHSDKLACLSYLVNSLGNSKALTEFIDGIEDASRVSSLINHLDEKSQPSGCEKLKDILAQVNAHKSLTIRNHIVRLVNDLSANNTSRGPENVARIINGLRYSKKPEQNGVNRLMLLLEGLGQQSTETLYNAPDETSREDHFGRLTTLLREISGKGSDNVVTLINDLDFKQFPGLVLLIRDVRKIRVFSDLINGASGASDIVVLLNHLSRETQPTGMEKLLDILNKIDEAPELTIQNHMVRLINELHNTDSGAVTVAALINGLDQNAEKLSGTQRLVNLMKGVFPSNPENPYLNLNDTGQQDPFGRLIVFINTLSANASSVDRVIALINKLDSSKISNVSILVRKVERLQYLVDLIHRLYNIDLMVVVLNGVDHVDNLVVLLNQVGSSVQKGSYTKTVGDMSIIADTINLLGYQSDGVTPRPLNEQNRINLLVNGVTYCGIKQEFDTTITTAIPPEKYFHPCDGQVRDGNSPTPRLGTFLLGLDNARPVSIIVGDVRNTEKTLRIMNAQRDIHALTQLVNLLPGEVTAKLINTTSIHAIYRSLAYMANNLEARAMASLIHFGTGIGDGRERNGQCRYYTGVGPERLGKILNVETGESLKNVIRNFGWRTAIPALVCGLGIKDHQVLTDQYPNEPKPGKDEEFSSMETIAITGDLFYGDYVHHYEHREAFCGAGTYYPEIVGNALTGSIEVDRLIHDGKRFSGIIKVNEGISSVWNIINNRSVIRGLLETFGGGLPYPPEINGSKDYETCGIFPQKGEPPVQYVAPASISQTEVHTRYEYGKM